MTIAACKRCSSPLVFTFERDGYEWYCVECDDWFQYLQVDSVPENRENILKLTQLEAVYKTKEKK